MLRVRLDLLIFSHDFDDRHAGAADHAADFARIRMGGLNLWFAATAMLPSAPRRTHTRRISSASGSSAAPEGIGSSRELISFIAMSPYRMSRFIAKSHCSAAKTAPGALTNASFWSYQQHFHLSGGATLSAR